MNAQFVVVMAESAPQVTPGEKYSVRVAGSAPIPV